MRRLLIRPGGIGDCILSFPALEHLISDSTEVWVPSAVVPLVHFGDCVRPISSTGLDLLGLPGVEPLDVLVSHLRTFDSIVSWYGANRDEFRRAALSINPHFVFHRALPPLENRGHAIDFYAWQVGAPLGLSARVPVRSASKRDTIVIHPFSGGVPKNWPLARFRELASLLPLAVEWSAGPEEKLDEALRFETLGELAAWIAGSRLYIGNDSGITHLAAAVGVPTLAIFVNTSPSVWAPRSERAAVAWNPSIEEAVEASRKLLRLSSGGLK